MPKRSLRSEMLVRRSSLSTEQWQAASQMAQERLLGLQSFQQARRLALYAPLIKFTGINQHLAVKHQHLVRRGDIERSGKIVRVVFLAHRISSLIRQMYFSASVRISATCFLRFGLVRRLGLKVKLYSSRWIMA